MYLSAFLNQQKDEKGRQIFLKSNGIFNPHAQAINIISQDSK